MRLARISKNAVLILAVTGLASVVACGSGTVAESGAEQTVAPSPTPSVNPATETAGPSLGKSSILAAGEFQLPAADSFGEPGFHEVLAATHELPSALRSMAGLRLVLRLWDAGRPGRKCDSEHPLSGCATVDWSDAPGRPNVPPGGVFDNSITLQFAAGERSFFLSQSGALNDQPDAFDPG